MSASLETSRHPNSDIAANAAPKRRIVDVAIVGGSIAGSVAALSLVASGLTVAIFEQCEFPRRKACGEGLSARGVTLIQGLGLSEVFDGSTPFDGYSIWVKGREHRFRGFGEIGRGCSRTTIDTSLLELAAQSAELIHSKVRRIEPAKNSFRLTADGHEINARFVVLACGMSSPLVRRQGFRASAVRRDRYGASMLVAASCPMDRVHIVKCPGFELFCTPIAEGVFNLAVLGDGSHMQQVRAPQVAWPLRFLQNQLGLQVTLLEPPLFAGPFGMRHLPAARARMYLVGDSAEVFDPIGGMGMTHAIDSAICAVRSILRAASGACSIESAAKEYCFRREQRARPLRIFTDVLQSSVQSESAGRLLAFAGSSGLARLMLSFSHAEPTAFWTRAMLPPLQGVRLLTSLL